MKTSEVFKQAKRYLWKGKGVNCPYEKTYFLCVCLDIAVDDKHITRFDASKCQRIIRILLAGSATLTGWLQSECNIDTDEYPNSTAKLQETRGAWLDHLIEHYASLGD